MANKIPVSVFKAYDIRGTLPNELNPEFAYLLGRALAQQAHAVGVTDIVVGYDGRVSSPTLASSLQKGIQKGGINTTDIGLAPTPLVYYATHHLNTGSGVAITGSHNPPAYNGFKIMLGGKTLYGEGIQALRQLMLSPAPEGGTTPGQGRQLDVSANYLKRVTDEVTLARPLRIAIDCGNGVGGVIAERLFTALGCEVIPLYCEVDGNFPNHHPDPADPDNLQDLIQSVQAHHCELGLAFDGDADRLGVVTHDGHIIWPDRQLILFAQDVLSRQQGATILYDVKCSRHVGKAITHAGGKPLMWRTGHSLIKAKMAEIQAPLGGEMSGHIFFKERWYGFDDGLYAGARLLEILSQTEQPGEVLNALPQDISTPELKVTMQEGEPQAVIAQLQQHGAFPNASSINTIDGVRAEYPNGFGLARASNTTPVIVLRFEAETTQELHTIQTEFKTALLMIRPDLALPF